MSGWWYPGKVDLDLGKQKVYVNGQNSAADINEYLERALKRSRFEIEVENDSNLYYTDPRNFGNLYVTDFDGFKKKYDSIGIDLSYPGSDINEPLTKIRAKKLVKQQLGDVLLDQSVLSGIGNIYRAEALYLSKLSPFRTVGSCTDQELKNLINMSSWVLNIAYQTQGVMHYDAKIQAIDHLNGESINGHLVYWRRADPLGRPVISSSLAGRTIWWVPEIQA